jgi:hypothetical protein
VRHSYIYTYSCAKCGGSVDKPKVEMDEKGKFVHGLHGWCCSVCGKGVKVKRTLNQHSEQS